MPRYREIFKLDPQDLDLIEQALREQVASAGREGSAGPCPRTVQDLLGRLHAQKIFYSQAREGGMPNG